MKNLRWLPLVIGIALLGAAEVEAGSKDAVKHYNSGVELMRQGNVDGAIGEFQVATQEDPGLAPAHVSLASALEKAGRTDEAIAAYKTAVTLDPQNAVAFNNLGVLYMRKDAYDEAIQTLEQGLKVDASNARLRENLANAKNNKDVVKEREVLIGEARKQTEARPKDPQAAYALGRVYAKFYMKDEAFEWLGRAMQLGFNDIRFMQEDPLLAGLRSDPRLAKLLEGR
jgi:superkiller protein 3